MTAAGATSAGGPCFEFPGRAEESPTRPARSADKG